MKNALALAKLGWQPRLYDPHLRKWLHRISVPTLIVWGDNDKLIPPAYGPAYPRSDPGRAARGASRTADTCRTSRRPPSSSPHVTNFIEEAQSMKFYCSI